jgi:hypothetical protein
VISIGDSPGSGRAQRGQDQRPNQGEGHAFAATHGRPPMALAATADPFVFIQLHDLGSSPWLGLLRVFRLSQYLSVCVPIRISHSSILQSFNHSIIHSLIH